MNQLLILVIAAIALISSGCATTDSNSPSQNQYSPSPNTIDEVKSQKAMEDAQKMYGL